MRRAHLALLAGLSICLWSGSASAINDNAGTTGYGFLKIGVGARPAALGGAFTAVTGDLEATGWNPASLHGLQERSAALSYSSYLVDTETGFLSLGVPGETRAWALSMHYVSYGDLRKTDVDGNDLGTFGAFDVATYLTATQQVWDNRVALGANLKAIYSTIDDYTSDAYVIDLGIVGKGPIEGMTLGASLANLGSVRSGYTSDFKDDLPVLFRLGVAHRPAHAPLPMLLLMDYTVPNDNDAYLSIGVEIQVADRFYLRPGYSLQETGDQGDDPVGLSAGAGLLLQRYRLDYAFTSYPALGDVHRVSVSGRI
ncbi:PorV/PorQ family protein [Candidatus Latescibacterota bacterium]